VAFERRYSRSPQGLEPVRSEKKFVGAKAPTPKKRQTPRAQAEACVT
jgi:hypothetical protein